MAAARNRHNITPRSFWTSRVAWAAVPLAALLITAGIFAPALTIRSAWIDDADYVLRNRLVCAPSWDSTRTLLTEVLEPSTVRGYYHPLAMISLMLDYAAGARLGDSGAFRGMSWLLHSLNTMLVALLLLRLGAGPPLALLGAVLFGVHPQAVESVAWIAERKNLLSAFFGLLTLLLYLQYVQSGRMGWFGASLGAFVLALLSKPAVVPLPLWLILLDIWPLRRYAGGCAVQQAALPGESVGQNENPAGQRGHSQADSARYAGPAGRPWRLLLEKLPFLGLSIAAAVLTYLSQRNTAFTSLPQDLSISHTAAVVLHNIGFYLVSWLVPLNLAPFYSFPPGLGLGTPLVWGGVLVLLLLPFLAWRTNTRPLAVGVGFFLVGLAPVLGLVGFTNSIAADRFSYLPSIGLVVVVSYGLAELLRARRGKQRYILATALAAGAPVLLLLAALGARSNLAHWRDTPALWEHALAHAPTDRLLLLTNYADLLAALGQAEQARGILESAIAEPPDPLGYYAAAARTTLANLHGLSGDIPTALPLYYEALKLRPDQPEILNSLAWWRASAADPRLRDGPEAVRLAERAVAQVGAHPAFLDTLAAAYAEAGRTAEAAQVARQALAAARVSAPELADEISARLRLYEAGQALPAGSAEAK